MGGSGTSGSTYSARTNASAKKRGWRKVVYNLKLAFFDSLISMMKSGGEERYPFIPLASLVIECIQTASFAFTNISWGMAGNATGIVLTLTQIEHQVVGMTNYEILLGLVAVSLALIVVMGSLAAYVIWAFYAKEFKAGVWPLRVLRVTVELLQSVAYLPVLTTLLATTKCPDTTDLVSKYGCYTNWHLMVMIISLVAAVIFIPFSFLMSLASFEPNPKSSVVAKATPTAHLFDNFIKTMLVIVFSTPAPESALAWIYLAATVVSGVASFLFLPYYRESTNRLRCIAAFMLVYSGILTVAVTYSSTDMKNAVFWILVAGTPVSGVAGFFLFRWRWSTICPKKLRESMKKAQADPEGCWEKALFKMEKIHMYRDIIVRVNFVWFTNDPELILLAEKLYQAALENLGGCPIVSLSYGMFLKLVKNDLTLSSFYFKKAENQNPPLHVQFAVYQAEMDRRERIATREGGSLKMDAVDRVEYRHLFQRANQYHREVARQASLFWAALASSKANPAILNQIANTMERNEKAAVKMYTALMGRFAGIPAVLVAHIHFLNLTARLEEASELQEELDELLETLEEESANQNHSSKDSNILASAPMLEEYSHRRPAPMLEDPAYRRESSMNTTSRLSKSTRDAGLDGMKILPLPTPISRSRGEKRAHAIYRRMVKAHQTSQSSFLSKVVLLVMFLVLAIDLAFVIVQETLVGNLAQALTSLYDQGQLATMWTSVGAGVRALQYITSPVAFSIAQSFLSARCNVAFNLLYGMYDGLIALVDSTPNTNYNFLTDPIIPTLVYHPNATSAWQVANVSLVNHVMELDTACQNIVNWNQSVFTSGSFLVERDFRYAVGNSGFLGNYMISVLNSIEALGEVAVERQIVICWSLCAFAFIMIVACGIFLFRPAVAEAKRSRQLAIEAFLQIPKDVVVKTYTKYKFEGSQESRIVDADGDSEDEDTGDSPSSQSLGRSRNVFKKITFWYILALAYLCAILVIHMAVGLYYLEQLIVVNKRVALSASVPTFLFMANHAISERAANDSYSYYTDAQLKKLGLSGLEISNMLLEAVLNGNASLGMGESPVPFPYLFYMSGPFLNQTNFLQLEREVFANMDQLLVQTVVTPTDPIFLTLQNQLDYAVQPFGLYLNETKDYYMQTYDTLNLFVLKAFFPIFLFFVFMVYIRDVRGIMGAVISENERTLRILLMLPVEVVSQIESIRTLLHMDTDYEVPQLAAHSGSGSVSSTSMNPPPLSAGAPIRRRDSIRSDMNDVANGNVNSHHLVKKALSETDESKLSSTSIKAAPQLSTRDDSPTNTLPRQSESPKMSSAFTWAKSKRPRTIDTVATSHRLSFNGGRAIGSVSMRPEMEVVESLVSAKSDQVDSPTSGWSNPSFDEYRAIL
ncbi:hypothetical protein SmJEL517_g04025 [Synchytrium microbalum]|uniref:TmcB/TmcC TPR repeats domain-containing protein n=1 Tax=Synchytrium microbalum TaxID=1806994 RepID=A0A507C6C0_9FUNG|nr:uncharacterized protein SmJEL517_g04025 [Synchytrium microbalum]TPX33025.1 hypothetical protein SmJEL517_g04025 [Synchytrium microbalum]